MKVTEVLVEEHRAIERMLRVLGRAAEMLEAGKPVEHDDLDKIIKFLKIFADRCHHGKEEDRLFPAMEAAGIPREGGPIEVMLEEHRLGRELVRRMAEAAAGIREGEQGASSTLVEAARSYISLLTQHIEKEDKILFPLAELHIPGERKAELLEGFERFERKEIGEGRHEELLNLLRTLEERYLG